MITMNVVSKDSVLEIFAITASVVARSPSINYTGWLIALSSFSSPLIDATKIGHFVPVFFRLQSFLV